MISRKARLFLLCPAFLLLSGCPAPTLPPATAGGGWILQTVVISNVAGVGFVGGVGVQGHWEKDQPGASGDASPFSVTTNLVGLFPLPGKRAPATWNVSWISGGPPPCAGLTASNTVSAGAVEEFICFITEVIGGLENSGFAFSPGTIVTDGSSGSEAVITGAGFSSQYGLPLLQYFDLNGNLVAQTNVSTVAGDGSWVSAPIPDISQLGVGTYVGIVKNANSSGGYDFLGAAAVQVVLPPPPPPPPDPCPTNPCAPQS